VYSAAQYREKHLKNQFFAITYRDSEHDQLLYCSVNEILHEPCSFSQLFLEVSEEAFTLRNKSCIADLLFQIVTMMECVIKPDMHYIPAEYQYLKFMLNILWPKININRS
jgi:hypothetical protein